MTINVAHRRLGWLAIVSFSLSALELVVVGIAVMVVVTTRQHHDQMLRLAGAAWVFAGLGSIGFAIASLIGERGPLSAIALAVAILAWLLCGIQMIV